MDADSKRALVDRYIEAYNACDVESMLEVIHPEIVFQNVSGGVVDVTASGIEAFRELALQSKQLFAARSQAVTRFEPHAEGASVDVVFTGVLAADLPNGLKAGDRLHLTGRSAFVFRDEKIYRLTDIR
jgi:hypothetical protein